MFSKRGYFWVVALLMVILASCSGYNKLLKSTDFELKYQKAIEYYDNGDYNKALPLLEELLTLYKGTDKAEKVYYYYSWCNYSLGDLILAGYHFGNFAKTFPSSNKAEECYYMNAYCFYLDSPEHTLDQTNTHKALQQLQLFVNRYPNSDSIPRCNELMDNLRGKLEKKSYETSKLYFNIGDYKAAITSLENTIKDYPASDYRQEMSFLIVKAHYELAINSVEKKKQQRLKDTIDAYHNFVDTYPESKFLKDAEGIYSNTVRELNKINNT